MCHLSLVKFESDEEATVLTMRNALSLPFQWNISNSSMDGRPVHEFASDSLEISSSNAMLDPTICPFDRDPLRLTSSTALINLRCLACFEFYPSRIRFYTFRKRSKMMQHLSPSSEVEMLDTLKMYTCVQ